MRNKPKPLSRVQSNWDGPTASSVLCCKRFEQDHFIVEGVCYCKDMEIPAKKWLKLNAIPIPEDLLGLYTHGESSRSTPPRKRRVYEKQQRQTVSVISSRKTLQQSAYIPILFHFTLIVKTNIEEPLPTSFTSG